MDAKAILDSAADGWWYPAVVVGVVLAFAIWKAFHFKPDRPGETVLPLWVLTGGAVLAAVPFFGQLLVHGTMPDPAPGLFLLVFLSTLSLLTNVKQQLRETGRRRPRP